MPITPAGVVRDALTLPPSERAAVAALLLESLDAVIDTPESVEAAWEAEIRRSLLSRLGRFGRYASETGASILLLARNVYEQGRYAEAYEEYRRLLAIYKSCVEANVWPGIEPVQFLRLPKWSGVTNEGFSEE